MKFVDSTGSTWEAVRHTTPWTPLFRMKGPLAEGASPFDGSNNPAGLVLYLVGTLLFSLPFLVEAIVQLVLLPFFLAFRYLGWINTIVEVRCTAKVVGQAEDGTKDLKATGPLERWSFPVSGFGKAGQFRDALMDFVKENGRSADAERFAAEWLNNQLTKR